MSIGFPLRKYLDHQEVEERYMEKYTVSNNGNSIRLRRPSRLPLAGETYKTRIDFQTKAGKSYFVNDRFFIEKREDLDFVTKHGISSSIGVLLVRDPQGFVSHWGQFDEMVAEGNFVKINVDPPRPAEPPNPYHFIINECIEENGYLLADITYPNCTNFEGRKIVMLDNVSEEWLRSVNEFDPHFEVNGYVVARFEPTQRGIELAIKAAKCQRN